jgi:hypothetical protein
MPTKRIPIGRPPAPRITPRAIELYAQAKRLLRRPETEENERALSDVSYQLSAELGLEPWATDPLDCIGCTEPPQWERGSELATEDWYRSAALRDELEQALRDRRRARRQARPNGSSPQPSPPS